MNDPYRKTPSELWRGIQEAARRFPVGTEWQHYGGDVYEITGHGVDEATGEAEVRYIRATPLSDGRPQLIRCNIGDFPVEYIRQIEFHRLATEFGSTVDALSTEPRYRRVRRCEHYERS